MKELLNEYGKKKVEIVNRLQDFKNVRKDDYFYELLFCLFTPQSNAKKCWEAVSELKKFDLGKVSEKEIASVLRTRTRFHNNKARYVKLALKQWDEINNRLRNRDFGVVEMRNWLAENVNGMGLKEAGHFLRNIGKSDNKVAILDRHILRNLNELKVIDDDKIKGGRGYLEIEKGFIDFSDKIGISIDELDLLFWSKENGEIFK